MDIHINLTEVIQQFDIPKSAMRQVTINTIKTASWAIYQELHRQVDQSDLKSTRSTYHAGIQRPVIVIGNVMIMGKVELVGMLPNMLESGIDPFDMKEGFRRSAKAIRKMVKGKNGAMEMRWYLTIPFRHATSGALGESMAFASQMPKEVENLVKSKGTKVTEGGDTKSNPLTMSDLYKVGAQGRGIRGAIPASAGGDLTSGQRKRYKHASPISQGISRHTKTYEKATQGKYMSFRRVSEKSLENSWIHKGLRARKLMEKTLKSNDVKNTIGAAVKQEAINLGL